jgi:hypothetical protein
VDKRLEQRVLAIPDSLKRLAEDLYLLLELLCFCFAENGPPLRVELPRGESCVPLFVLESFTKRPAGNLRLSNGSEKSESMGSGPESVGSGRVERSHQQSGRGKM